MKKNVLVIIAIIAIILVAIGAFYAIEVNKEQKTDWDYIKSKGELIIGYEDHMPLNYLDDEGNLIGFDTEFAEALTEKIGVKAVFQTIDWDAKETELNAKNVDCIWNGLSVNKERAESMDLTIPYMNNKKVIITRTEDKDKYNNKEDLKDAVVVANTGSINEEIVQTDPFFSLAKYVALDSQTRAFMEVSSGSADIAVVDYVASIATFMENSSYKNLTIAKQLEGEDYVYAVAFRKNSPETLKVVNKAIEELQEDGTLKKIAEKYDLGDIVL